MRVLVTGANGYLGQGIVSQLLDEGVEVIATDMSTEYIDNRACIVKANIFEIDDPYEVFEHPDVLLHLAWRDGFKHDSINHIKDIPLHYQFVERMAKYIHRIAIMGSMHEIGFWEGCVNDTTPANPLNLYGIAKNALRQSVELMEKQYGFKLQWVRGFYIVGNSETGCSVFSKITQAEKRHEESFPFTQGTNQYDFIDYNLFCEQVSKIVQQEEVCGIINCCSGKAECLADRVERFICKNGYAIKLQYGAFPDRPYDSKAIWGDDTKIRLIMGK